MMMGEILITTDGLKREGKVDLVVWQENKFIVCYKPPEAPGSC